MQDSKQTADKIYDITSKLFKSDQPRYVDYEIVNKVICSDLSPSSKILMIFFLNTKLQYLDCYIYPITTMKKLQDNIKLSRKGIFLAIKELLGRNFIYIIEREYSRVVVTIPPIAKTKANDYISIIKKYYDELKSEELLDSIKKFNW